MEKFWMVWNVDGRVPTMKHASQQSARLEAERLAKRNPGQQFAVLEAIGVCETTKPVQWAELTLSCDAALEFDDGIPF